MSDKELQNAEVKDKIIKGAIEEFAENGYKAASTNSICKKAKVSKGLIYYYFKSKEETLNTFCTLKMEIEKL